MNAIPPPWPPTGSRSDPAPIASPYDFNRDGLVNATDQLIARSNQTNFLTALKLIGPGGNTALVMAYRAGGAGASATPRTRQSPAKPTPRTRSRLQPRPPGS